MNIKVKDVVKLCAIFLRLENVLNLSVLGENNDLSEEELAEANKELELLIRCTNLVCTEIAAEYYPLKAVEKLCTDSGNIAYSSFSKIPVDIYSVKKQGIPCPFKLYPNQLITTTGNLEIDYTYMPQNVGIDDELDFVEGKISARIIAYGLAAEYCLICGLYEEAIVWDKRYKDSLQNAVRTLKPVRLPKRRWY